MTSFDFHAVNRAGVTVHTFGDLNIARKWVRANPHGHEGLHVEAVTTIIHREVVYRPRAHLREVAA